MKRQWLRSGEFTLEGEWYDHTQAMIDDMNSREIPFIGHDGKQAGIIKNWRAQGNMLAGEVVLWPTQGQEADADEPHIIPARRPD